MAYMLNSSTCSMLTHRSARCVTRDTQHARGFLSMGVTYFNAIRNHETSYLMNGFEWILNGLGRISAYKDGW